MTLLATVKTRKSKYPPGSAGGILTEKLSCLSPLSHRVLLGCTRMRSKHVFFRNG